MEDGVLPLLVVEPAPTERDPYAMSTKFLALQIKGDKLPELPAFEDTRFYNPKSDRLVPEYLPGEDQPLAYRYRLMARVKDDLRNDPESAWLRNFSIRVRTGQREVVEEPRIVFPQ